jgi:BirA family biotin operon repressor/biotin-[acetyl-CoA-carboxylase] ligase
VGDALAGVARIDAVLKWPNDVLVPDGGKLAGILAERAGTAIALGVGLNVTTDAAELPAGATSLRLAGAASTDREPLLKAILRALDGRYAAWLAGAVPAADYRRRCATIGRRVRVELPDGGAITGQAADVDEHGRLVLREDAGARHELSAGDVVHLRAGSADPC